MASRRSHRLRPTKADPEPDDQAMPKDEKTIRRRASLYDAVAGRVTSHRINPPSGPSDNDNHPPRQPALAPEEVLFRRKHAPPRYAEKDVYFAGTDSLPADHTLPASDLLKAVHGYAAGFYEAVAAERERSGKPGRIGGRLVDERSMDETALVAFGVLLEEAAREALGRKGDLVFTEAEGVDGDGGEGEGEGGAEGDDGLFGRVAKRRRLSRGSTAG